MTRDEAIRILQQPTPGWLCQKPSHRDIHDALAMLTGIPVDTNAHWQSGVQHVQHHNAVAAALGVDPVDGLGDYVSAMAFPGHRKHHDALRDKVEP